MTLTQKRRTLLANGLSPISMILGNYFNDKPGPRRVIMMEEPLSD